MYFSSIVDLVTSILISLIGILINVKFLKNMKDEERNLGKNCDGLLIKRVMTTYTMTLIVSAPISLISSWFLYENFELPTWLQCSLCYMWYFGIGYRIYLGFNSLVVAAMRYAFIVHHNAILQFGKEKAKNLFYYGSLAIPIIVGILHACTVQKTYFFTAAVSMCQESYKDSYNRTNLNVTIPQDFNLPVYTFVHQYISTDVLYYIRGFVLLLTVIILSNVVEGILYYKTFSKIKR